MDDATPPSPAHPARLRIAGLPLLTCLLGAFACSEEEGTDTDGPNESALDQLSCPDLSELVTACNYKRTFEENTGLVCPVGPSYVTELPTVDDPFAPTEECVELLLELWEWEDDWFDDANEIAAKNYDKYESPLSQEERDHQAEKREAQRQRALTGLHALFFHPLLVGPERTLFVDEYEVPEKWITNFGVAEVPSGSLVLDEHYYNADFLHKFYHGVAGIRYHDPLDYPIGSPLENLTGWIMRRETVNGISYIDVNPQFIDSPYVGPEYAQKYAVAPVFALELGHILGAPEHTVANNESFDLTFGTETFSSYAHQAMFGSAMLIGAAFSRMPGKQAYLTDYLNGASGHLYKKHCVDMFYRILDLDEQYRTPCLGTNYTYLQALMDERDPDMEAYNEDPCDGLLFACPAELEVGTLPTGGIGVTIPSWVFHYVSEKFDGFVMDAAARSTTVAPPGGAPMAGFSIDWIHPDSLIAQFGIHTDDVVVAIAGAAASNVSAVERGIDELIDTGEVEVVVWRNNQLVTIAYTITD